MYVAKLAGKTFPAVRNFFLESFYKAKAQYMYKCIENKKPKLFDVLYLLIQLFLQIIPGYVLLQENNGIQSIINRL